MRRMGLAVCCGLLVLSAACRPPGARKPREITVRGVAEVIVPPDFVVVRTSVVTLDNDVEKAQADNDRKVKAVLAFVRQLGIEPKDIRTEYTSLARKEREQRDKPPEFLGFEATNTIGVTLRDVAKYDALTAGVIKLGVNRISGIDFGATNETEKRREARLLAIKAAREKAEYLAAAVGQSVGRPLWISEMPKQQALGAPSWSNSAFNYAPQGGAEEADAEQGTLAPGSKTIRAQVEVSFLLVD